MKFHFLNLFRGILYLAAAVFIIFGILMMIDERKPNLKIGDYSLATIFALPGLFVSLIGFGLGVSADFLSLLVGAVESFQRIADSLEAGNSKHSESDSDWIKSFWAIFLIPALVWKAFRETFGTKSKTQDLSREWKPPED